MSITINIDPPGDYLVSFPAVAPAPRFDDEPWTSIAVDEATAKTGPWIEIGSADLDPVDDDPADPAERDITVRGVELEAGWYRITFLDADGLKAPVRIMYNGAAWSPTPTEVAELAGAYTREHVGGYNGGREQTTFTDTTTPTITQVKAFITNAVSEVAGRVGQTIPSEQMELAHTAALWNAVAQVHAKRRPAQTDDARSDYSTAIGNFRFNLDELTKQVRFAPLDLS